MTGDVKPQDEDSGLVERTWTRRSKRRGELTERTLEGEHVEATFLDRHGGLQHAAGTVTRNPEGRLVIAGMADGVPKETPVPRDANVDATPRPPRSMTAAEREVLHFWQTADNGMDGPRGKLPPQPDDAVASMLLDAAGTAMSRGDWQRGVNILKLVVRDYRQSQEAACARRVIDRLADRGRV